MSGSRDPSANVNRDTSPITLVVGVGYTGHPLAKRLADTDRDVIGTTRDASQFDEPGYELREFDLKNSSDFMESLPERSFEVVFTAGPPRFDSMSDSIELYRRFLEALDKIDLVQYLFLSSTSVYGDANGEWVTETSPLSPSSRSGELKAKAEQLSDDVLPDEVPVVHARIGGIYGPGRGGPLRYLSKQYKLVGEGEKITNRIYRDDLVRILSLLTRVRESSVYNVADRKPVTLKKLVGFLYRETGRDPEDIEYISWDEAEREFSEMRLGLLKPQKKVSSRKLREKLPFEYEYPDAFQGMKELLDQNA
ncbi:MAG: NAD-dependent epimerase/dehydratase family protein [bacterium]